MTVPPGVLPDEPYLLEVVNVSKGFPGVVALSDVQLRVRPGSVLALMGENGAGKSTLMKIIAGIYQPDAVNCACGANRSHSTPPWRRCRPVLR